jgi:hypothetical protein
MLTGALGGKLAEVEVASLDLGDQIEAEWAPLIGICYDYDEDLIEIALEGVDHLILAPRAVYIDFDVGGLIDLEVIDVEGVQQIIKLKNPPALVAREQVTSKPRGEESPAAPYQSQARS